MPYASVGGTKVTDRADVFFVAADGSNLEAVVADATEGIKTRALPLLERFRDPAFAYRTLLDRDSTPIVHGEIEIVLPGAFASPARYNATMNLGHLVGVADPRTDIRAARARRSVTHL